jgi:hypothetical protein
MAMGFIQESIVVIYIPNKGICCNGELRPRRMLENELKSALRNQILNIHSDFATQTTNFYFIFGLELLNYFLTTHWESYIFVLVNFRLVLLGWRFFSPLGLDFSLSSHISISFIIV